MTVATLMGEAVIIQSHTRRSNYTKRDDDKKEKRAVIIGKPHKL